MTIRQRKQVHAAALLILVLTGSLLQSAETSYAQACRFGPSDVRDPDMIRIPGGTFFMGSPVTDKTSFAYRPVEKPQHKVTVDEFWIARFLVTAEEFCKFLNDVGNEPGLMEDVRYYDRRTIRKVDGCFVPQEAAERCPADPVTWAGANAYCEWLSRKLGRTFRLPTEAEWELAARGVEGCLWPWGDEIPIQVGNPSLKVTSSEELPEVFCRAFQALTAEEPADAFPADRMADADEYIPFYNLKGLRWSFVPWEGDRPWMKAPVGSFPRNATPQGVYDMLGYYHGQWCSDAYLENAYAQQTAGKTVDTNNSEVPRVLRGGYQVPVDYRSRQLPILSLRWLLPGDAKWPQYTAGRTWSRKGGHPTKVGAMFRLAMSPPGPVSNEGKCSTQD